jgi:dTDP-4-amino-4,6-dideoxygalactose transaminase
MDPIPFNYARFEGREQTYLAEAVASGHLAGDGRFTRKCHALLEKELGVAKALLTTSCTHALEMAALLLDIQPGDDDRSAFTLFPRSTPLSARAWSSLASRCDTLNLDDTAGGADHATHQGHRRHTITVYSEMDVIMDIAARQIPVAEDNAHGLFVRYRPVSGHIWRLSRRATRPKPRARGRAAHHARSAERAEIIRERHQPQPLFAGRSINIHVDAGPSYLPSELLAMCCTATGSAIKSRRNAAASGSISRIAELGTLSAQPTAPDGCEQPSPVYLLLPALEQRQRLIAYLRERGIASAFHYLPLNTSEMGQRCGGHPGQCPVAESASERLLRLPFYNSLDDDALGRVVAAVQEFRI